MASCDVDSSSLSFPHSELFFFPFWLRTGIIGTPSLSGQAVQDLGRFTSANTFGHSCVCVCVGGAVCKRVLLFGDLVNNSGHVNLCVFGQTRS